MAALGANPAACSPSEPAGKAATEQAAAEVVDKQTGTPAAAEDVAVQGNDEFAVTRAWIRAAPPGAMMLAGYFTLDKQGGHLRRLVGARSDAFGDVSIHRSVVEDGISKMRPAGALEIAPGESLIFEPGGLHLMLMSPRADVSVGRRVPIWLCFEDGDDIEEIPVDFEVRRDSRE